MIIYFRYFFLSQLIYPIFIPRRYYNSITRFQFLLLVLYGIANGLCLLLPPLTVNAARSRAGFMACFNMLPLFLGERTSVIAKIVNIPLTSYFFAHHWIGRMAILHSFIHMFLAIASKGYDSRSIQSKTGIFASTTMLVIFASSIYPIRKRVFEVFFRLHQFLAILVLGLTFWHLFPLGWERYIYPTIALCLWMLHMAYRLSRHNIGTRTHNFHIQKYQRAVEVKVDLEGRFHPRPGQFFYVQSETLQAYDKFQSHPFMIFWWEEDLTQTFSSTITFLIETKLGFTLRLANGAPYQRISLDGPHGQNIPAEEYDTVILAAKGIGIAGVLAYAQYLIWMKSRKRIRTRKVDIYWELEENQQEVWAGHYFNKLEDQSSKVTMINCLLDQY
ncbi:hypothetical protein B0O99DRAFT_512693 [Bisporella sp. PMI_857]|nr:hypothetical protein B0O99DRAFT_512693 [Bisporella sp. PMI_857]